MRRITGITLGMGALWLALAVGSAQAAPSASGDLPRARISDSAPQDDDVERAHWQKKAVDAYRGLAQARQRYDAATARLSSLRSRNRDRGDVKVEALKEKADAKTALEAAEQRFESLSEEARVAGVPPGWIRVFDEDWMSETEDEPASIP